MIDLHCHILPGIDDGPRTVAQSIALASELVEAGVQVVAATPHIREDHPRAVPAAQASRCRSLAAELEAAGIKIGLVSGGEVDLVWALEAPDPDLRLVSYGAQGSDLLIETPYGPLLPTFEGHLETVLTRGYRVLLAHPERNPTFQRDPARLRTLVERGVLLQITTGSLLRSPRRSGSGGLARALLRERLVHVLASDAHSATETSEGHRGARAHGWAALKTAYELVGGTEVEWMVSEAPRAILEGEPLPRRPTQQTVPLPQGLWRRRRARRRRCWHKR